MDVLASYLVPKQALGPLYEARQRGSAGCSGGFCWVQVDGQLHLWRFRDGSDARMRSLRLPRAVVDPLNPAPLFMAILQHPRSNAITVVACSSRGAITAWMDANHLAEPITAQLVDGTAAISSFAASVPEDSASGPVFVGAAGMPDGSWLALQGSAQGIITRHVKARIKQQEAKGMLGKIGSVISWGYSEAFDPSAKLIKKTPSGRPVVDVHVVALDASRLRITVLTDACVESWLVTLGLRPSEQLLWSFQNLHAVRQAAVNLRTETAKPGAASANLALGLGAQHIYIWMHDTPAEGGVRHFMQRLLVDETGQPVHDWSTHMHDLDLVPMNAATHQLACDAWGKACLCLLMGSGQARLVQCTTEGGHMEAEPKAGAYALNISPGFVAPEPKVEALSADLDAMAVAAGGAASEAAAAGAGYAAGQGGGSWVLLSSTYGVVELSQQHPAGSASAAPTATATGPLTAEQCQQVFQLLDTSVNQALLVQQQQQQQQQLLLGNSVMLPSHVGTARPLLALVAGLSRRLEVLGALVPSSNMVVLGRYSTHLTDLLPKQWTEGSMTSSPGASFLEQLTEKAARHAALLDCLAESAVLYRLEADVQRVLLENAEKLAVALALLNLQASLQAAAAQGQQGAEFELMLQVLHHAGQISGSRGGGAGGGTELLQPLELFYAQPSISMPALLQALAEAAQQVSRHAEAGLTRPSDQGSASLRSQVALLAELLGTAVAACSSYQAQLAHTYKLSAAAVAVKLGQPGWMEGSEARGHIEAMLLACQALHSQLGQGPGSASTMRSLFGITEVLLTGFAAAVAAAPAGNSKSTALAAYRAARGRHVPVLLKEALQELQQGQQCQQQQQQLVVVQHEEAGSFVLQVEELCRLHHCYPQLYTLCRTLAALEQPGAPLSSSPRLLTYLGSLGAEEGAGPRDTFAAFVFQKLLEDGLHAELLKLPANFQGALAEFMQAHAQLLWLLLARAGDWGGATAALTQTAARCKENFNRRHRLVCLSKLSAHAAGDMAAASAASSQLRLLQVQEKLGLVSGGPSGLGANGVVSLPTLVDAALKLAQNQAPAAEPHEAGGVMQAHGVQAALLAVEALAVCPAEERLANKSRWRLVWRQLLELTDWAHLNAQQQPATSSTPGTVRDVGALLQDAPLYAGAQGCCGRGVFGFAASVTDSGPVQEVRTWLLEWCAEQEQGGRSQSLVTMCFDMALTHYSQRAQQAQAPWVGPAGGAASGEDLMVM